MIKWVIIWSCVLLLLIPRIRKYILDNCGLSLTSYRLLKKEVDGFGYTYSYKKHLMYHLLGIGLIIVTTKLFQIHYQYLILLIFISCFVIMQTIRTQFIHAYEEHRFNQVITYLNHFCSVFKVNAKILETLEEIKLILDDEFQSVIENAITKIEEGESYHDCLAIITKNYDCSIIRNLHTVVCEVEQSGAFKYEESLDILLEDTDDWLEDVYGYRNIKKINRNKIFLMVLMSLVIGLLAKNLIPSDKIKILEASNLYQFSCFIFFLLILITLFFSEKQLSEGWINKDD